MKLIVGLGNPGSQYRGTRHNVGFEVVDELARRWNLMFESSPAEAVMARGRRPDARLMLVKPLTFMNLSGVAVNAIVRYYRIDIGDLLVVADDVNLTLGQLRARRGGSDGGHNGLRSVIDRLGTTEIPRLRVGVDRGDSRRELSDHVLAAFDESEQATIRTAIVEAGDAAELFVGDGIDAVMNRYNRTERDNV